MSVADLIKAADIEACGKETDVLYALIAEIPVTPSKESKDKIKENKVKIKESLAIIRTHFPAAATSHNIDVVQAYADAAEKYANKGEDPSDYINAANDFINDCTPEIRGKKHAEMSLIESLYHLNSGDLKDCMMEVANAINGQRGQRSAIPEDAVKEETYKLIARLRKYVK